MGKRKFTLELVQKDFVQSGCELLEKEYKNTSTKMKYKCSCGEIDYKSYENFRKGQRCKKCKKRKIAEKNRKYSLEIAREIFQKEGCVLLAKEYKNVLTPMPYICICGNQDCKITLSDFMNGSRCKKCGYEKIAEKKRKYNIENFREIFEQQGCELLDDVYLNIDTPMNYICICGNPWKTSFYHFINGARCRNCQKEAARERWQLTFEEVKSRFERGDCELLEDTYINSHVLMKYRCSCGNISQISLSNFMAGKRCKKCGIQKMVEAQKLDLRDVQALVESRGVKLMQDYYENAHSYLKLTCMREGHTFFQSYANVYVGKGCPICTAKKISIQKSKTHEQFVKEVFELVGEEYSIISPYKNAKSSIYIKHNSCGNEYIEVPDVFLQGKRCMVCHPPRKKDTERYKSEVFKLVGDDYAVLGEYENANEKIQMKHSTCNQSYSVTPSSFLNNGTRCPFCYGKEKKTLEQFKAEVFMEVGDEYAVIDEYINARMKLTMRHEVCGFEFPVAPSSFLSNGSRCPKCNESKGERKIADTLEDLGINFQRQYRINECRYIKPLPFDVAILKNKQLILLIEYQGIQHFKADDYFGGEEKFKETQTRDQIKREYCKINRIPLLEIKYWEFESIEEVILNNLSNLGMVLKKIQ